MLFAWGYLASLRINFLKTLKNVMINVFIFCLNLGDSYFEIKIPKLY
ncbi:hypothetical protein CPR19088_GLDEOEPO_00433 [Companilactobacillus paralimentarius]